MMNRRLIISEAIQHIGRTGVVGVGLLAFSLSVALTALLPSWRSLDQRRAAAILTQEKLRQAAMRGTAQDNSPAAELHKFYGIFPTQSDAPALLSKVYAAAEERNLSLRRGEYASSTDPRTGLVRYRLMFPVRGSYAQIREFVSAALGAVPALAMDDVSFERPTISESMVEARIRFTLYLKKPT
jgi:Tfp pilus assembly protein PilO